jgi:hypothetical protein
LIPPSLPTTLSLSFWVKLRERSNDGLAYIFPFFSYFSTYSSVVEVTLDGDFCRNLSLPYYF